MKILFYFLPGTGMMLGALRPALISVRILCRRRPVGYGVMEQVYEGREATFNISLIMG